MMTVLLGATTLAAGPSAMADGFICETSEKDLNIKVFNHNLPQLGTRNVAVMVLSDPRIKSGRKTIARFAEAKGTLANEGSIYTATVNLRENPDHQPGKRLVGTRLGQLENIVMEIDFQYSLPLQHGELTSGRMSFFKKNGSVFERRLDCTRYLKRKSSRLK